MFKRFLLRRRVQNEQAARRIFAYFVDGKKRYADPMEVALSLQMDAVYTPEHLTRAKKTHDPESMEVCAQAAAKAFDLNRLDPETGTGATIAELIGLIDAFDTWCFVLQKKT